MEQEDPQRLSTFLIERASLSGEITIPPSKSHTLRALLFASLGTGNSRIFNPLASPDTEAMIEACRQFGARITIQKDQILVEGTSGKVASLTRPIHAGNSGLVLRLCSAVGALSPSSFVITGDHSIQTQRPMTALLEGLSQLGARVESLKTPGYAPLRIQGPLTHTSARIVGADSQPISALLIAASFLNHPVDLFVTDPGEKPWVALTLDWFNRLGIPYHQDAFSHFHLYGNASYPGFEYTVPGDLSSAAFPIAAALITHSEILIRNVDLNDCQGDKALFSLFQRMGALVENDPSIHNALRVRKSPTLRGLDADVNDYIDAVPILATLATFAQGTTRIYNAAIAQHKECNRLHCIATELTKMGGRITETEDGLIIYGAPLKGTRVDSHHDHRMALSLCVAALGAEGKTLVSPVDCIAKTFPSFRESFNQLGAGIQCI